VSKPIGVTVHREDGSALKIGIHDLAAAAEALRQVYGGSSGERKTNRINADGCPVHGGEWRVVPAGISKSSGKPFPAFYACVEMDCKNRPSRAWEETHPIGIGPDQADPPEPRGVASTAATDFDDLPF